MKIDGLTLTDEDAKKITAVLAQPELVKARKAITLYKAHDDSLALFRVQAANMLTAITVRAALHKPLKVKQARWANAGLCDENPMYREFFEALSAAVGYSAYPRRLT